MSSARGVEITPQPDRSKLLASLLIGGGFFFLAANLGWLGYFANWLRALLFLVGGIACLYLYDTDKTRWWALIPGIVRAAHPRPRRAK